MAVVEIEPTTEQIQRGLAATLAVTFYVDGVVADPGVTTVTVTRLDGTAIVTGAATGGSGAAARTYALAGQADLDILTVSWTSATHGAAQQTVEIVGELLFTFRQARAFDGGALASTATYTTDAIGQARKAIAEEFEQVCGVSFVPRLTRETIDGAGQDRVFISHLDAIDIRAVEMLDRGTGAWTAYTPAELADVQILNNGRIRRRDGTAFVPGRQNVRVTYEHGYARPPAGIVEAALLYLRFRMVSSNLGSRTISASNEYGSEQYWTPGYSGRGSAINELPFVDKVLRQYMQRRVVVG